MSNAARRMRAATPRLVDVAARRARLRVVPRRRVRAPRVPFVTLVSLVLVGGVVGLLVFNTQMQQASFTATTLEERAQNLGAREQTLQGELERLDSPNHVMAAAREVGLVGPPASPAQLWLETGRITGEPSAATADAAPRLQGRAPAKPAELDPAPDVVVVPAPDPAAVAAQAAAADAAAAAAVAAQQAADQAAAQAAAQATAQAATEQQKQERRDRRAAAGRR